MRKLALGVLFILAGCAAGQSLTPEQNMAVMCRAYPATLNGLAPFNASMSADQIAVVDRARMVIRPVCAAAAQGAEPDLEGALTVVRAELRRMLIVEQEVKP